MNNRQKQLGQNFLTNRSVSDKIVSFLETGTGKTVLEIGPGKGILTESLLKKGFNVVVIEIDNGLIPLLNEKFKKKIVVINDDVLKVNLNTILTKYNIDMIISNLPYSISTAIMKKFIKEKVNFQQGVFMFQKEVAEKIRAKEKSRNVGALSVLLQHSFKINKKLTVKPGSFNPPPKIDSEVLLFDAIAEPVDYYEKEFVEFVYQLFSQRRKKIKRKIPNILKDDLFIVSLLEKRVEEVSFEEIEMLYKVFKG